MNETVGATVATVVVLGIGLLLGVVFVLMLRRPGNWNTVEPPILAADRRAWQPVITRLYRGNQQQALAAFGADYATLGPAGYVPISQVWVEGSWGCGAFAIAALLILFVGLGLLIIAYLLIVKPAGTFTVTYQLQAPPQPSSPTFQQF